MSEEQTEDNKIDIKSLGTKELDELTEEQVQYVRNQAMIRRNPKIVNAVTSALNGKEQDIIAGLAREPFAYITPEIEIITGLKVRFRSLYTFQTRDVSERTSEFMRVKKASELLAGQYMNQLFLVHGLESINGEPIGMAQLPENVWQLEGDKVKKACDEFVMKRMSSLDMRPQSLISALVTANQVFQEIYDDVVNLRSNDKEKIESRAERLVAGVGKSTGPQVAGQKPT